MKDLVLFSREQDGDFSIQNDVKLIAVVTLNNLRIKDTIGENGFVLLKGFNFALGNHSNPEEKT